MVMDHNVYMTNVSLTAGIGSTGGCDAWAAWELGNMDNGMKVFLPTCIVSVEQYGFSRPTYRR